MLVTILTKNKIKTAYRFYGARHSVINLGFKIDFSIEQVINRDLLRLRDVMHIGFEWLANSSKLFIWQQFCTILYDKLKGVNEIDEFYYQTLESCAHKWQNMSSKRIAIEALIIILELEGRLDLSDNCFICKSKIDDQVSFIRGFAQTHPVCANFDGFAKIKINALLRDKTAIYLNDESTDKIWRLALQGFAN